jgi:hypothetical protein
VFLHAEVFGQPFQAQALSLALVTRPLLPRPISSFPAG